MIGSRKRLHAICLLVIVLQGNGLAEEWPQSALTEFQILVSVPHKAASWHFLTDLDQNGSQECWVSTPEWTDDDQGTIWMIFLQGADGSASTLMEVASLQRDWLGVVEGELVTFSPIDTERGRLERLGFREGSLVRKIGDPMLATALPSRWKALNPAALTIQEGVFIRKELPFWAEDWFDYASLMFTSLIGIGLTLWMISRVIRDRHYPKWRSLGPDSW